MKHKYYRELKLLQVPSFTWFYFFACSVLFIKKMQFDIKLTTKRTHVKIRQPLFTFVEEWVL